VVTIDNVTIGSTIDLVNNATLASFVVQDSSGGAQIFASDFDIGHVLGLSVAGDRINVTGTTSSFNGLFQLAQPSLATTFVASGAGAPASIVTTSADYQNSSATAEALESKLVSLAGVSFTGINPGQTFAGATNYTVTDGVRDVTVRIQTGISSLVGDQIPTGKVNLTGVFTQFDATNPLPGVPGSGYQLLPLDNASIVLIPEPTSCVILTFAALAGIRRSLRTYRVATRDAPLNQRH
jgi:hypothetical protein